MNPATTNGVDGPGSSHLTVWLNLELWPTLSPIDIMVQNTTAPIRIVRLSHMRYQHADLSKAKAFLEDFGMTVAYSEDGKLYFAGKGPDAFVYVASSVRLVSFSQGD